MARSVGRGFDGPTDNDANIQPESRHVLQRTLLYRRGLAAVSQASLATMLHCRYRPLICGAGRLPDGLRLPGWTSIITPYSRHGGRPGVTTWWIPRVEATDSGRPSFLVGGLARAYHRRISVGVFGLPTSLDQAQ